MEMKPLDPAFPLQQQLAEAGSGPVVLLNVFTLAAEDESAFLTAWEQDANFMKAQPGYISTQLHRAVGPSPAYFNEAVWDSLEAFRAAFSDPGFRAKLSDYPSSAVTSPHLFKRVAIHGLCVA